MRAGLLRFFRVSERPAPPPGSGAEPEIFRASKRFFYYSILAWVPKQVAAFMGLLASLAFFGSLEQPFVRAEGLDRVLEFVDQLEVRVGPLEFAPTATFWFFEALAIVAWAGQLLYSALFIKLGWELRWYIVGDSSLRLREGLWSLREQTMTIANIQNMRVKQGPVQRLFGISDLEVQTAGGAGSESGEEAGGESKSSFHIGRFRGLEDAHALRDRIRVLLARHRGAGLGDQDDPDEVGDDGTAEELRTAAAELLEEARGLRAAATAR